MGMTSLVAFSVEIGPASDAEAVHDACMNEVSTVGSVRPWYFAEIVDLELRENRLIGCLFEDIKAF